MPLKMAHTHQKQQNNNNNNNKKKLFFVVVENCILWRKNCFLLRKIVLLYVLLKFVRNTTKSYWLAGLWTALRDETQLGNLGVGQFSIVLTGNLPQSILQASWTSWPYREVMKEMDNKINMPQDYIPVLRSSWDPSDHILATSRTMTDFLESSSRLLWLDLKHTGDLSLRSQSVGLVHQPASMVWFISINNMKKIKISPLRPVPEGA